MVLLGHKTHPLLPVIHLIMSPPSQFSKYTRVTFFDSYRYSPFVALHLHADGSNESGNVPVPGLVCDEMYILTMLFPYISNSSSARMSRAMTYCSGSRFPSSYRTYSLELDSRHDHLRSASQLYDLFPPVVVHSALHPPQLSPHHQAVFQTMHKHRNPLLPGHTRSLPLCCQCSIQVPCAIQEVIFSSLSLLIRCHCSKLVDQCLSSSCSRSW